MHQWLCPVPNRGAFCLMVLLGLGGGCVDDGRGAHFSFDQPGGRSTITSSGFCLGTHSTVMVTSGYVEELPPWTAESSDTAVFALQRDMAFPDWVDLTYLAVGEAQLIIRAEGDTKKLDDYSIHVWQPEGMASRIAHPMVDVEPFTGEAILPVDGGTCALKMFPYRMQDGEEHLLYGKYDLVVGDYPLAWTLIAQGFQEPSMILFVRDTTQFIVHASTTAAGPEEITFTGPVGIQTTVALRGVEAAEVTELELQIAPYYSAAPEKVGDSATFVAVQHSAPGRLCRGFPVVFTSETPDTLWIRDDGVLDSDCKDFEFLAPGPAEVTISVPDRPELTQTMTWNVQP